MYTNGKTQCSEWFEEDFRGGLPGFAGLGLRFMSLVTGFRIWGRLRGFRV